MKITITNTEDLGMPAEMITNCTQLLEDRIRDTMTEVPEPGTDLEVLYSEKHPLGKSEEVDDEAYFIYFTIDEVNGQNLENAEITVALVG